MLTRTLSLFSNFKGSLNMLDMDEGLNLILGEHQSILALAVMNILVSGPWPSIPADCCLSISFF